MRPGRLRSHLGMDASKHNALCHVKRSQPLTLSLVRFVCWPHKMRGANTSPAFPQQHASFPLDHMRFGWQSRFVCLPLELTFSAMCPTLCAVQGGRAAVEAMMAQRELGEFLAAFGVSPAALERRASAVRPRPRARALRLGAMGFRRRPRVGLAATAEGTPRAPCCSAVYESRTCIVSRKGIVLDSRSVASLCFSWLCNTKRRTLTRGILL